MQTLSERQRRCSIGALAAVLANEHILRERARGLRWVVDHDRPTSLGGIWNDQCQSLDSFVTDITQRASALRGLTHGTVEAFVDPATLARPRELAPDANEALRALLVDHERVAVAIGGALDAWRDDLVTATLMRELLGGHERMAEALETYLKGS